jgi:hypothetical protein
MLKQTLIALLIIPVYGFLTPVFGQKPDTIRLENPSFEDEPSASHTPVGWFDCGFQGESPPDTHPSENFKVTKQAFEGSTYLGLVTRDVNTWESIGQKLKTPLLKNVKYSFSVYLCRSNNYQSKSRLTGKDVNYVKPIILRIHGVKDDYKKSELLAESKLISSIDWEKIDFIIEPKDDFTYFVLEAYYRKKESSPAYNGNILVDNASDIVPIVDKN